MRITNMCLVLKLDNGKVVSIANGQNHRRTATSSTVLVYRFHMFTFIVRRMNSSGGFDHRPRTSSTRYLPFSLLATPVLDDVIAAYHIDLLGERQPNQPAKLHSEITNIVVAIVVVALQKLLS